MEKLLSQWVMNMNNRRIIQEGIESLLANRVRSALSVLGIIFGVAAVVAMLAVVEGARNDVLERLSRLGTNVLFVLNIEDDSQVTRSLQFGDAVRLENASDIIEVVAPAYILKQSSPHTVIGITPDYIQVRQLAIQQGRAMTDLDLKKRSRVCVVGREILGVDGNRIGIGGVLVVGKQMYKVVGIIASEKSTQDRSLGSLLRNHNNAILIPLTAMPIRTVIDEAIVLTELSVRTEFAADLLPASDVIRRALSAGQLLPPSVEVVIPRQLLREEQQTQRIFALVVGCVALIGVLVGGIGVMNIMLANVAERCKEIGIRRAIGATKRQITTLFLVESTLLTLFGGIGGLVLGVGASFAIAQFAGWSVTISAWSLFLAFCMSGLVGIVAGWYPSRRAAALDPVEAMRRE
jgi:putative ABC transport system permease protein